MPRRVIDDFDEFVADAITAFAESGAALMSIDLTTPPSPSVPVTEPVEG